MTWDWQVTLWLLLSFFPGAVLHELGHVVGGWAMGCRGASIRFGKPGGKVQWVFRLGPLAFEINPGLGLWFQAPRVRFAQVPSRSPWRRLVWVLGGPVASALLFAAFWPGAWADMVWWPTQIVTWQQLAQWWGLWGVVVPLFPLQYPSGHPSDGLQVAQVLRDLVARAAAPGG